MTYNNILIGSDGTEASEAAIGHAISIAEAFDASLRVVYVRTGAEPPPGVKDPGEHPDLKAKRQQALSEPKKRAEKAGIDVTAISIQGTGENTADLLVQFANEEDIDLVVLGTHGRSGLDRWMIGSVAEGVVRNAPVPVVTARPDTSVENSEG